MMVGNRAKTAYGFTHRLWAVGSAANLLRQRLDKFGPVYARECAPLLAGYGLVPLDEVVNSPRPGFSRVFCGRVS